MQKMTPLNRLQYLLVLFLMLIWGASNSYSQCPTVLDGEQSFCNIPTPLVADLVANDTGGGVRWFSSANSTTPLSNSTPLTHGGIYYAGDTTGVCTTREHVIVTIVGPPVGLNFQGVCVDNPNDATISDLFAIGNDVRWYNTPSGGAPLLPSTVLTDNTIYYADQANPDTGCRTSRLAVYVNVGVVPVSTGSSVQEFCSTQDPVPTVADLVTNNNNNNWYETPTSATPLDTSTPLVDGQSYYATTVDSPCESIERFEVLVVLTPPNDSGEDGSFEVCENDINNSYTINLFDGLGGTPNSNGVWTGPFPTSNGGLGTVNIVGMIIEDSPYVFTYTVSSSVLCDPSSSTVSITIMEGPDAGSDSALELCDTDESVDLFTMLGGTPDVGGTWSPALSSGTGLFDPSVDSPGDYTYTVPGSLPCSSQSAIVTVVVSAMPDAGLDGTVDICSNSGPIDLFSSLGGTPEVGGTWSPALSSGTGIYDPLIDNPGVYTYTVFGTPPCGDDTANVIVTLTQAPDAGLDAILDLCEDDSPVDLFEVLGGTPNPGGEWSPTLSSGTGVFNPQVDPAGVYNYTVSGTSPCADDSATVTISITPAADAGIDGYLGLCETDSPVDLFTILGGTPDSGGTWSPALSSGTGVFDPQVDSAGVYTYEVEGVSPCGNDQANVTVTVFSKPDAGNDRSIELCETDSPVDLFAILGGAPEIGGTWSPALSSGNGIFDPTTDAPGVYTYHVSSSTIFCGDDSATVTVSVTPAADAGLDGFIDLCETDGPIDLFTVLGGTPDIGGVWSPALSSGTGIFDSQVDPPGVYTYTVSGTSPCNDDDSAVVTVSIIPSADADLDGSLDLCESDNPIDLFTILGGTPDSGGTWSPTLSSGTGIFDPQVDPPGVYTYTVSGTSPCADDSAIVTITITPAADAGLDGFIDLCETDGPIDLFTVLGGTPDTDGVWSPTLSSGTGIFDPQVDLAGVYTYTVSGTSPCNDDDSAEVTVSIIPSADAGLDGSLDLCESDNPIDLFTILGGTPDSGGTWSPTLSSGTGVFDPQVDSAGVYTYTISGTSPCADDSAIVTITITPAADAGLDGFIDLCETDGPIDLFTVLGGTPDTDGVWSPALSSGTGIFDPQVDLAGVYTYTVSGTSPCNDDDSAEVTVSIIPAADAGLDGSLDLCETDSPIDLFTILGGTPDSGGTWSPTLSSGTGVFDPQVDSAGVYTYTVSGTSPCADDSATVTITITPAADAGLDGFIDLCETDGPIDLFTVLGGTPDTGGVWSPALSSGTGIFDPQVDLAGVYTYTVSGTSPCNDDDSAEVTVSIIPSADAGLDGSLDLCESDNPIDLFTILGGTPDSGGTWSPTLSSGTGVFDPQVDSAGVYTYTVSGTSPCADDSATVTITITPAADAGLDGFIDLCETDGPIDLFTVLGGTPDTDGVWSPALSSGTGIFDPQVDPPGVYTYTVSGTSPCNDDDSAEVTVSIIPAADAGLDGSLDLCESDNPIDLFTILGGTPDSGGTWSPTLSSGTGVFDPQVDSAGVYTYTVSGTSPCADDSATVTITITPAADAGLDGFIDLCETDGPIDLFTVLGGTPDTDGVWSPALSSGTGIF